MNRLGRPRFFDIDIYLSAVEGMINADEVERALWMLDNVPAYFRQNPTPRLSEIRKSLHRQLFTPVQYKGIYDGAAIDVENQHWPMRAVKLEELIREYNNQGQRPHLMELAPGGGWMRAGLEHKKCAFTYEWLGLDYGTGGVDPAIPGEPVIFCAFEIIEHLSNEWEIYQNYLKFGKPADVVMLSTPLFTYAGGMDDWRNRPLGHLRTYSPIEFHTVVAKMFQGLERQCFTDDTILLVGRCK